MGSKTITQEETYQMKPAEEGDFHQNPKAATLHLMSAKPNSLSVLIAFALIGVGFVIAAVGGIKNGSVLGGLIALAAVGPCMQGIWKGMQQETQGQLGLAIVALALSLLVGGALLLLRVVNWF